MRWLILTFVTVALQGCGEPSVSPGSSHPIEVADQRPSQEVRVTSADLHLPVACGPSVPAINVTIGLFEDSVIPWLFASPDEIRARMARDPLVRGAAGRRDGLLTFQPGGYLTNQDFTIQCRDTGLLGGDGLVRCRLTDPGLRRIAGFDVPATHADCTGFIARDIQRQLPDLGIARTRT